MKLMCCIVLEITKGENTENRDYREKIKRTHLFPIGYTSIIYATVGFKITFVLIQCIDRLGFLSMQTNVLVHESIQ